MVLCKWLYLDPWPFPQVSDLGPFGPSCLFLSHQYCLGWKPGFVALWRFLLFKLFYFIFYCWLCNLSTLSKFRFKQMNNHKLRKDHSLIIHVCGNCFVATCFFISFSILSGATSDKQLSWFPADELDSHLHVSLLCSWVPTSWPSFYLVWSTRAMGNKSRML